ncbi:MAG: hypothetical protein V3T83_09370 [Acidobacteriota bacterium]
MIYTIPPSSPLHYVTYVYVYESTDDTVYVGYTPGYSGTVVYQNTVVYGTGYYYSPWVGSYWWGWPVTYGYGAGLVWMPWGGWGFHFGFGWGWGHYHPYWGPWGWHGGHYGWGPRGWRGGPGNYYRRWGRAAATGPAREGLRAAPRPNARGAAFNSRSGRMTAGGRGGAAGAAASRTPFERANQAAGAPRALNTGSLTALQPHSLTASQPYEGAPL